MIFRKYIYFLSSGQKYSPPSQLLPQQPLYPSNQYGYGRRRNTNLGILQQAMTAFLRNGGFHRGGFSRRRNWNQRRVFPVSTSENNMADDVLDFFRFGNTLNGKPSTSTALPGLPSLGETMVTPMVQQNGYGKYLCWYCSEGC